MKYYMDSKVLNYLPIKRFEDTYQYRKEKKINESRVQLGIDGDQNREKLERITKVW